MKIKTTKQFGFVRVGTAVPKIRVADPAYNGARVIELMQEAQNKKLRLLVFPELTLTGYTCRDLFQQLTLQTAAVKALAAVLKASQTIYSGLLFIGLPLKLQGQLFNCAVAIKNGKILGVIPKTYLPTYKEFEEWRWFASALEARVNEMTLLGQKVPFGTDLLFAADDFPDLIVGAEICEDLWGLKPPSVDHALFGATVEVNLSASNELIGKGGYRRELVVGQTGRCMSAYVYCSSGPGESSNDVVFGGHCIIAENGSLLTQSERFQRKGYLALADVDVERLARERMVNKTYSQGVGEEKKRSVRMISFSLQAEPIEKLERLISARPFVPADNAELNERCREIFNIQVSGLVQRLEYLWTVPCKHCRLDLENDGEFHLSASGCSRSQEQSSCSCYLKRDQHVTIGVSGGLDSTLALLVTVQAFDALGVSRKNIHAYTLPGFGTTGRTKTNAIKLMQELGVSSKEVDIREQCFIAMRADGKTPFNIELTSLDELQVKLGELSEPLQLLKLNAAALEAKFQELKAKSEKPFNVDLCQLTLAGFKNELDKVRAQSLDFENEQARTRTKILMQGGFVIGTGDLSEAAVGWCTYNADQQSMYNVNASIPKTLVRFLVKWAALEQFAGNVRGVLIDITQTEVSPELLPLAKDGKPVQKTNDTLGPDELRDFYMYYLVRFGFEPEKILYLCQQAQGWAQEGAYSHADMSHWLKVFLKRFFPAQYKRSNAPDSTKVGSVSFSQRGDWRQPSDASSAIWLDWAEKADEQSTATAAAMEATATTQRTSQMQGTKESSPSITLSESDCLLVVDVQGGFTPKGGSWPVDGNLAVPGGYDIIALVNQLIAQARSKKAKRKATRDAHKPGHATFASRHGVAEFTTVTVGGVTMLTFKDHCIDGSAEAELHPDLDKSDLSVYDKGTDIDLESLSGFFDFAGAKASKLPDDLKAEKVKRVFIVGLATNYCVEANAMDALKEGYEVYVIEDACRGIDNPEGAVKASIERMRKAGVKIIQSTDILSK